MQPRGTAGSVLTAWSRHEATSPRAPAASSCQQPFSLAWPPAQAAVAQAAALPLPAPLASCRKDSVGGGVQILEAHFFSLVFG